MLLFAITIFLGAFLLFQVQPLMGKYILPWFGGSAGVWTVALLFFQFFLLLGYAYAHGIATWLRPRWQGALHLALIALTLVLLPVAPSDAWRPGEGDDPTLRVLLLLTATVGAPYLILASTGPLLQYWFAGRFPGRSPYRLYSLSNAASLLALLSYPVFFERIFRLQMQSWIWSGTYVAYAACCAFLAWRQFAAGRRPAPAAEAEVAPPVFVAGGSNGDADAPEPTASAPVVTASAAGRRPVAFDIVLWLALPAVASALLLATTNRLTQDVAVVPFLWVLPLSLYLLSFILTFDDDRWYDRRIYSATLAVVLIAVSSVVGRPVDIDLLPQIGLYNAVLFFVAMSCHGELVRLRPATTHLTLFYLMVSAGGALGGLLVAIVAPQIFDGFWEYHIGLLAAGLLVIVAIGRSQFPRLRAPETPSWQRAAGALAAVAAMAMLVYAGRLLNNDVERTQRFSVGVVRNFYGVVRVVETGTPGTPEVRRELVHGRISHGFQYTDPDRREWHTSYYAPESGAALALMRHPARVEGKRPLRIGVAGLGTGTLATFAGKDDYLRFYEINPKVLTIAREIFTYLEDAERRGVDVHTYLGDARIVMERHVADGRPERFDVLVLDAFNSDAVPVHLLTEQARRSYVDTLAPDGILVFNVSNLYLDLVPVVRGLADSAGWGAYRFQGRPDSAKGLFFSDWVVVTRNEAWLADAEVKRWLIEWRADEPAVIRWTDDYSNLLRVLK
ncbi:MAG: hypothetical protein FJZ92_13570 [Chloroflexi bacterium]|nr:hypothetical protein [Chloroflexota bacterium]